MRRILLAVVAATALWTAPAFAVQEADFRVVTADDVLDVCGTTPSDPLHTAAANFCQGFVIGAIDTYEAFRARGDRKPIFCLPTPAPNRNEGIASLVAWGKAHPEYKDENPSNFLFKFLAEKWPCEK
jgi:Rap1a immunity proteins